MDTTAQTQAVPAKRRPTAQLAATLTSYPTTRRVYYLGYTYWVYLFQPKPHIITKRGGVNLFNPG
jgi:hypothetical protein